MEHYNRKCLSVERLYSSETRHLSNVICGLPQGFKDLFVVFQVDISEHVSGHFISFAQVSLQAFFIDLPLKLCYDRPRLNQADTENKEFNMLRCSRMAPSVNTDIYKGDLSHKTTTFYAPKTTIHSLDCACKNV